MGREELQSLIPHSGSMCLLDSVVDWNDDSIACETSSHLRENNPFTKQGRLDSVLLVEYGAQAAAVHAGLIQNGMGEGGTAYIGAVKNLQIFEQVVDQSISMLNVSAQCILNNKDGAIYQIECGGDNRPVISARVVLILPTEHSTK